MIIKSHGLVPTAVNLTLFVVKPDIHGFICVCPKLITGAPIQHHNNRYTTGMFLMIY